MGCFPRSPKLPVYLSSGHNSLSCLWRHDGSWAFIPGTAPEKYGLSGAGARALRPHCVALASHTPTLAHRPPLTCPPHRPGPTQGTWPQWEVSEEGRLVAVLCSGSAMMVLRG